MPATKKAAKTKRSVERERKVFKAGEYLDTLEATVLEVEKQNRDKYVYKLKWDCCGHAKFYSRSVVHRLHNAVVRGETKHGNLCPKCKIANRSSLDYEKTRARASLKDEEQAILDRIACFCKNQWPVPAMLKQYGPEQQYPTPYAPGASNQSRW
jgi:phage FluMu protein Com